jgi:type III secretory pathway component EscV
MSLFAKAKKAAPAKKTKVDSKPRVDVNSPDFFEKIQTLQELNDRMKSDKAKADMISDEIRDVCKDSWAKLYEEKGVNPESIMVESKVGKDVSQVMFIPQDKYITIDETRAEFLREEYGDSIVEETTTFAFDNTMVEKYGEVLSRLIEECDEIDADDREKIIKAVTKFSVAKGTIDQLKNLGDVADVMEAVKPVVMLKTPEVIRG